MPPQIIFHGTNHQPQKDLFKRNLRLQHAKIETMTAQKSILKPSPELWVPRTLRRTDTWRWTSLAVVDNEQILSFCRATADKLQLLFLIHTHTTPGVTSIKHLTNILTDQRAWQDLEYRTKRVLSNDNSKISTTPGSVQCLSFCFTFMILESFVSEVKTSSSCWRGFEDGNRSVCLSASCWFFS